MGFLNAFKKMFRGKRYKVCDRLCAMGVDARIPERGRPEENIGMDAWPWGRGERPFESEALIEIRGSPIRWVNVLAVEKPGGQYVTSTYVVTRWVYVVPDPCVSTQAGYMLAKSVRVRSVPLIGSVSNIRWDCKSPSNLIKRISDDVFLNQSLIRLNEDITLCSFLEYNCWSILSSRPPSREKWNCYETIARHLLESSKK